MRQQVFNTGSPWRFAKPLLDSRNLAHYAETIR